MESAGVEISAAIERGILGQTSLLSSLATAIAGAIVALRLRLSATLVPAEHVRFPWLLYIAVVSAAVTVFLGFAISGYLVEIAPLLHSQRFDTTKQLHEQDFGSFSLNTIYSLSRTQVGAFLLLLVASCAVVLRNASQNKTFR